MSKLRSLTENHEFRRLYYRGKCSSGRTCAVYCLRNRLGENRLGLTVGAKLGCAVVRNRVRRRLRECYRALLPQLNVGYDVVIVARGRAVQADYQRLSRELAVAFEALGLLRAAEQNRR